MKFHLILEYAEPELSSVRVNTFIGNYSAATVKNQRAAQAVKTENGMDAMSAATKVCRVMHRPAMYAVIS
jgi:hypothetical protein